MGVRQPVTDPGLGAPPPTAPRSSSRALTTVSWRRPSTRTTSSIRLLRAVVRRVGDELAHSGLEQRGIPDQHVSEPLADLRVVGRREAAGRRVRLDVDRVESETRPGRRDRPLQVRLFARGVGSGRRRTAGRGPGSGLRPAATPTTSSVTGTPTNHFAARADLASGDERRGETDESEHDGENRQCLEPRQPDVDVHVSGTREGLAVTGRRLAELERVLLEAGTSRRRRAGRWRRGPPGAAGRRRWRGRGAARSPPGRRYTSATRHAATAISQSSIPDTRSSKGSEKTK